jgi:hypothetical protein
MGGRLYAVVVVRGGRLTKIMHTRYSLHEAEAWVKTWCRLNRDCSAAIIPHPISRAMRLASSKSRSA